MKLEDFVAESLKQIINGITTAQKFGASKNAKINPISARASSSTEGFVYCLETGVPLQHITFDVAVTVSNERLTSDDATKVGSISVSPLSTSSTQNSSISRIKFKLPVLLPTSGKELEI